MSSSKAAVPSDYLLASAPAKLAYSVPEFLAAVSIGRTQLYVELRAGRLRAAKCGKRTLIPLSEAEAWLRRLANPGEAV